ncbi:MAG: hypothetical protein F6K54_25205 [Okeania sp. SIO3B5]|uniref:hypothetical protein n=1 Tax=Okeania sp. SIO3B5 TaxID=2607811 RepID=UPI0014011FC0|nr:hypothetical protein [Okeania sp. SIO3B5]NEO56081.1 hypothetical protein [Okeania sp. SIO3B5]
MLKKSVARGRIQDTGDRRNGNYRGGSRKNCKSDFSAIISPKILALCSYLDRKACTFFDQKRHLPISVNALIFNQQSLISIIEGNMGVIKQQVNI